MNITVRYEAIDGFRQTRKFKTVKGARTYAVNRVGEHADQGTNYAVSFDGIGKITVRGCTIGELFAGSLDEALPAAPFEVWVAVVNEDAGRTTHYLSRAFTTLEAACDHAQDLDNGGADGIDLVGTTEAAKDAIVKHIEAQNDRYQAQCFMDAYDNPF
jgi:hypothetical protein